MTGEERDRRDSRALEPVLIKDPQEKAAAEARNGFRQYDAAIGVIQSALERGAFKLLPMRRIERDRAEQQARHSCGESTTVVLHFCHGNGYTTKAHCSCGVRVSMFRPRLRWSSISAALPIMRA